MNKAKILICILLFVIINIGGVGKLLAAPGDDNPTDIPTVGWTGTGGLNELTITGSNSNKRLPGTTFQANSFIESANLGRPSTVTLKIVAVDNKGLDSGNERSTNVQGYGTNVPTTNRKPTNDAASTIDYPMYFSGHLYIPQEFNTATKLIDTQLWGNVQDPNPPGPVNPFFPSIGFTNINYSNTALTPTNILTDGFGGGSIYVYDITGQRLDSVGPLNNGLGTNYPLIDSNPQLYKAGDLSLSPIKYDDWNHLVVVIKFLDPDHPTTSSGPGIGFLYYLNGKPIGSSNAFLGANTADGVHNLYTMAVNRNQSYESNWSELSVGQVILPGISQNILLPSTLALSPRSVSTLYNIPGGPTINGDVLILPGGELTGNDTTGSGNVEGILHNYGTVTPGTTSFPYGHITISKGYRGTIDDVPTINFNVFFGDAITSQSNVVHFLGPVLPGSDPTKIVVTKMVGSTGSSTGHGPGKGILLLDFSTVGVGSSSAGDFYLDGGFIKVGPYIYKLYLETDANWYLQSDITSATAMYSAIPISTAGYGLALLDSLHKRNGGKVNSATGEICKDKSAGKCLWSRVIWEHGVRDVKNFYTKGPNYKYNYKIFQVGKDLYYNRNDNGSKDSAGLYLAAGNSDVKVKQASSNDNAGKIKFDGYTFGAYWTHFGEEEWYTDTVIQGTKLARIRADSVDNDKLKTDGWSAAASFESGYPFKFKNNWLVEPQAQLIAQTTSIKKANDESTTASFNDYFSVIGRIGSRIARTWGNADYKERANEAWLSLDVLHEFDGRTKTTISTLDKSISIPFSFNTRGTSGQVGVGFKSNYGKAVSFHVHGDYRRSFTGKSWSCGGRIGLQIKL